MNIAIIWHMHQPLYRQPGSDVAILPWVRLHAVKDYLHMAQALARHPQMRATFTLTPSLATQLQDYASGNLTDKLMTLAAQTYFSPEDKRYMLDMCFSISWDNIIRRYPPYADILNRRHLALLNLDYFSTQTYRDLLVWFNLAWTDPNLLEKDPVLAGLMQKGRNFSVEDALKLMQVHQEIISQVLPTYRQLSASGQLELITTPFYHPILPLLVDSRIAQRPSSGLPIPEPPFRAPADAHEQLQWAVEQHKQIVGSAPAGLWPSEGAVAPEILPLVADAGLSWLATDEAILGKSLDIYFERDENGLVKRGDLLYRPWRLRTEQGDLAILFRDHDLSDRIGFVYQRLPGAQAAEDMIVRLERIARAFGQHRSGLITIILDGENAWEYYEHNGDVFLNELYQRLVAHPHLTPVLPSEHLAQYPPSNDIEHLASGSWIMGDFTTWMGDPEHIVAWTHLRNLRQAYARWQKESYPSPERLQQVQKLLFAAEGSDWFWWYSHRNSSDQDELFDELFRDYLIATYAAMNIVPPAELNLPISGMPEQPPAPRRFISPNLLATPDPSIHWADAAIIKPQASTGAMQQAGGIIQAIRYGNDANNLYIRIELAAPVASYTILLHLGINNNSFEIQLGEKQRLAFLYRLENGARINLGPITTVLGEKIIEFAIPLTHIQLDLAQKVMGKLHLALFAAANIKERLPAEGEAELLFAYT